MRKQDKTPVAVFMQQVSKSCSRFVGWVFGDCHTALVSDYIPAMKASPTVPAIENMSTIEALVTSRAIRRPT